jgi:hypothetical protein
MSRPERDSKRLDRFITSMRFQLKQQSICFSRQQTVNGIIGESVSAAKGEWGSGSLISAGSSSPHYCWTHQLRVVVAEGVQDFSNIGRDVLAGQHHVKDTQGSMIHQELGASWSRALRGRLLSHPQGHRL